MCGTCFCENEMKCSVKGYEPIGWCCEYCGNNKSNENCTSKFPEIETKPIFGYCLGCGRKEIKLDWVQFKTQIGFCHTCSINNNKKESS